MIETRITVTDAGPADLDTALRIQHAAFAGDDEAALVAALLDDPSARPSLSLLAWVDGLPVGHMLCTAVAIAGDAGPRTASILAPLAVLPDVQRQGVGRALIEAAAGRLAASGVRLLFVLGDPAYYTRCGFVPALPFGLKPPHPVEPPEAWMVRVLVSDGPGPVVGRITCATTLDRPEYWRE